MSNKTPPIQVGIIGFGFMGRTHALAYQQANRDGRPCTIQAIADPNHTTPDQSPTLGNIASDQQELDTSHIKFHQHADAILSNPEIDLVSICTHTDTHVDLAISALNAGKHVLVEKPIAINPDDVQRLSTAANQSDRLCIPAMCMRHWPAWVKIHEIITANTHGKARSATFHRLGSRPTWAADFYANPTRSGGVLHDLHIHDTDFIYHCFGKPAAVTTTGDQLHLTTIYHYQDIPHVTAQGAWDHDPSVGFQMKCTITFEQATLDFDLSREPQLILHQNDKPTPIPTLKHTGYDGEVRWILDQIDNPSKDHASHMQDAVQVAKILESECESMSSNAKVAIES
tara:strand:- start:130221 stop:131246 length:1026 start_codon:yes stop_codon:yes gene_type:complete